MVPACANTTRIIFCWSLFGFVLGWLFVLAPAVP